LIDVVGAITARNAPVFGRGFACLACLSRFVDFASHLLGFHAQSLVNRDRKPKQGQNPGLNRIILCAGEIDRFSSQAVPAVEPVNFNRARYSGVTLCQRVSPRLTSTRLMPVKALSIISVVGLAVARFGFPA